MEVKTIETHSKGKQQSWLTLRNQKRAEEGQAGAQETDSISVQLN